MQGLVDAQAVALPALGEIHQTVHQPFRQAEQGAAGEHGHYKAMDRSVGGQPPLPRQGDVLAGALLDRHPIVLEAEIRHEMPHGQQQKQLRRRGDRWHGGWTVEASG